MARGGGPVLGRVHWDDKHCTNWMLFDNITAFRTWSRELRKLQPEVRTEYAMLSIPGPSTILFNAEQQAEHRRRELKKLL